MAALTLSLSNQKKALSAKKNKKVVKNVLGLPASVKFESALVSERESENLTRILERLLPIAEISLRKNERDDEEAKIKSEEAEAIKMAKTKRSCLALGVNELNRSIKKKLISAALFASDIHPKFLIHHLNLLCRHNKIPFLHISGLRKLTRTSLGFPCIAVGFKKDSVEFKEVIEEIQSMAKTKNFAPNESNSLESETSDSEEEEGPQILKAKQKAQVEKNFSYLYRTSMNERVFIPEVHKKEYIGLMRNKEDAYIAVEDNLDDNVLKTEKRNVPKGISTCLIKKQAEEKQSKSEESDVIEFINEAYEVPKKKTKAVWIVDKIGRGKKFNYSQANIVKLHSNKSRKKGKK